MRNEHRKNNNAYNAHNKASRFAVFSPGSLFARELSLRAITHTISALYWGESTITSARHPAYFETNSLFVHHNGCLLYTSDAADE